MPKQLTILLHPDSRLRRLSTPIAPAEINTPVFQAWLLDLQETMIKKDGAGLAAPQVGETKRIIAVYYEEKTYFFINPQITKKSWARETEEEGCLSVLDDKGEIIYAPVSRYKKVSCTYLDEKGERKKISAEKILARIIQHEIDHLDGILFIDRVEPKTLKKLKPVIKPIKTKG
ncbi:MAG: peptide deformylase [Patescibacteria group bacterium]|jgi:peptide deformylase